MLNLEPGGNVWLRVCHRSHTIRIHSKPYYQHDTPLHTNIAYHSLAWANKSGVLICNCATVHTSSKVMSEIRTKEGLSTQCKICT